MNIITHDLLLRLRSVLVRFDPCLWSSGRFCLTNVLSQLSQSVWCSFWQTTSFPFCNGRLKACLFIPLQMITWKCVLCKEANARALLRLVRLVAASKSQHALGC